MAVRLFSESGNATRQAATRSATQAGTAMTDTTTSTTMPVLQIRNANGGAWTVHAEFPNGESADISGFNTENESNEWIAKSLQQWFDEREKEKA